MNDISTTPTETLIQCPACKDTTGTDDAFCNSCRYPLAGSADEQKQFLSNRRIKKANLEEANRKTRRTSNVLFALALLTAAFGFMFYILTDNPLLAQNILITNSVLTVMYTALGFWCRIKPLAAILSAIALFALVMIASALVNPVSLVSGLLLKIIVIGAFIEGLKSALKAEKLKRELNL